MSSRGARRRKQRLNPEPEKPRFQIGRTEKIGLAFLGLGVVAVLIAGVLVLTLKSSSNSSTNADTDAIKALAQRSIEVLPQGQWPSLYNDFTGAFQARCALADFTKAGEDNATALGASLQQLEFKELDGLSVTGDTAAGTIVGRYKNIPGSDYSIEADFARESGAWKITPAGGTSGCQAFNVLAKDTTAPTATLPATP
ncbi:MAG: hypothetical protein ABI559_09495 [Chloroflexota bacterium]